MQSFMNFKNYLIFGLVILFLGSCQKEAEPISIDPTAYYLAMDKITEIMIQDIFSPPDASRIFSYPNIAAYEVISHSNSKYNSLVGKIPGLEKIPQLDSTKNINPQLASLVAHLEVSKQLIISGQRLIRLRDSMYNNWSYTSEKQFEDSKTYGLDVAQHIIQWLSKDNYNQTRTMPKFTVNTEDPFRWQPSPPTYMDCIEPYWNKIRPIAIDSAAQFKPFPTPPLSMEKNFDFYKELKEVYNISNEIIASGDNPEEAQIAQFSDCKPHVSVTRRHLMFATKKNMPGAHWIGIAKITSKKAGYHFDDTIYAHTKTFIAIADAFISCWDEKYSSNLLRPKILINKHVEENLKPISQSSPFPEFTSGHSVVSGAAAIALISIFGENLSFDNDTKIPFGLLPRSFTSFSNAADEAAISRMYGGTYYRSSFEIGVAQGRNLGKFVINKWQMANKFATASL